MPEAPPGELPGLDRYRNWKPEYQVKALTMLRQAENVAWTPFYCKNAGCNGQPHVWPEDTRDCPHPFGHEWSPEAAAWRCEHCEVLGLTVDEWTFRHARADQRPPPWRDPWLTLLFRGGRGSGKTRAGAEITNRVTKIYPRIILIAATGPDLRDTMMEGDSGILATSPPGERPTWEPSKKRITWPNGCIGQGFSAEEPDRLRGPQSGYVWADEPSHWALVEECWYNMTLGLRLRGKDKHVPKIVATSTPKPTAWTKETAAAESTINRVVSTYANLSNLAPTFRDQVLAKHEGTRLGRQELHGEILEDVEGALWQWEMISWIEEAPDLQRIVVGVDPAGTANKKSDETGILVVGIGHDKNFYVLSDSTGKYSPEGWGKRVNGEYEFHSADAIVPERNFGEDMVTFVLENAGYSGARITPVRSRRGKDIRAEPIVALYEKKRVFHVGKRGDLSDLEEEMTSWVPHEGPSPNRVDALVHAITDLAKIAMPAQIGSPSDLPHISPTSRHLRAV